MGVEAEGELLLPMMDQPEMQAEDERDQPGAWQRRSLPLFCLYPWLEVEEWEGELHQEAREGEIHQQPAQEGEIHQQPAKEDGFHPPPLREVVWLPHLLVVPDGWCLL